MPPEPASPAVTVEVRHLGKSYEGHTVLHDVSFEVAEGEIFVIMGPSGAGKSVLLRHIIGLEEPDTGEVRLAGRPAADPATRREVQAGLVFQSGALFNSLTVYENLALYPQEHRLWDRPTLDRKIRAALQLLSLEGTAEKLPAELSGGMRKRAAVARALVMEPRLLLYDEPTSELDPILAATVAEIIATVRRETGLTSVVVSHDRDLALTVADRVALLVAGRVHVIDTPAGLRRSPDPVVQDFLNPQIDLQNPRFRKERNLS